MIPTLARIAAVAAVWLLVLRLPRRAPELPEGRLGSLDGLRGALALGVVSAHLDAFHTLFARGVWRAPDEPLQVAGEIAVALFFGITGFLFWSRALDGRIEARALYAGRLRRVYPLYLAVVVVGLAASLLRRPLEEDGLHLLAVLGRLAVPGRGLDDTVNGVAVGHWLSQAWTLHYELAFYLLLPLLAPLARVRGSALALAALAVVLQARLPVGAPYDPHVRLVLPLFAAGMVAAEIARWTPAAEALRGAWGGRIALGGALVYFLLPSGYPPLAWLAALAVLAPFACGGDPFGLFSRPAWRRLGEVSYSLYLLHNPVLYAGLVLFEALVGPIKAAPEAVYWAYAACLVALTVALSGVTFRFLERPFMGRRPMPVADAAP